MTCLQSVDVPIPLKLSAAWASTTLCYIYCDYFELYVPGKLQGMLDGRMGPLGEVTQSVLVGTSVMLIIPSLMIVLSVTLPSALNRALNLLFGVCYTLLMLLLAFGIGWHFYKLFALIEAALTAYIFWMALKWPRVKNGVG